MMGTGKLHAIGLRKAGIEQKAQKPDKTLLTMKKR
jgi:hypothetical protein